MKKLFVSLLLLSQLIIITAQASIEQPISFLQTDDRWGNEIYSISNDSSQTIATSGCGPTSMAMILNYYIDNSITPLQTTFYAINNGYRTYQEGTSWSYFQAMAAEYQLEYYQTSNSKEVLNWMNTKEDPLVICSMGPGLWTSNGHFIVLWKIDNNIAFINDPFSIEFNRIQNSYNKLTSQCRQYFCFNKIKKDEQVKKISMSLLRKMKVINSLINIAE